MKKLLALVLALVMTLSLCITSNAAFTDAADVDYDEAVEVLTAVGVFKGYEDGSFKPDQALNRAEAAKLIAYLSLGQKAADALEGAGNVFTDVPASHWACGYIEYCASAGYIDGVGDGKFDPAGQLTGVAFAKLLLGTLGYDAKTEGYTGTNWSINVVKQANALDLFADEDKSVNAVATREEAAQMMLNALWCNMVYYDGGSSVTINDVVIKQGADRKVADTTNFGTLNANGDKWNSYTATDDVLQLGEYLFSNKLLPVSSTDDFGRTAIKWYYNEKAAASKLSKYLIGTYAVEADHTYVVTSTSKTGTVLAVINELGLDATNARKQSFKAETLNLGDVVEVYTDNDGLALSCKIFRTALAKVTKVAAASAGADYDYIVTLTNGTTTKSYKDTELDGFDKATMVKDTYVALTSAVGFTGIEIAVADKVTGKNTGAAAGYVKVDGAKTEANGTGVWVVDALDNTNTFDFYLDANGYIIGCVKVTDVYTVDNIFYVDEANFAEGTTFNSTKAQLSVVYLDGTQKVLDMVVTKDSANSNKKSVKIDGAYAALDTANLAADNDDFFYAYTMDGEKVASITKVTSDTVKNTAQDATSVNFTAKSPVVALSTGNKYATSSTKIVTIDDDGKVTTLEGYSKLPNVSYQTTSTATAKGILYVYDKSTLKEIYVVGVGSRIAANDNAVYGYFVKAGDYDYNEELKANTRELVFNVKGEDTTYVAKSTAMTKDYAGNDYAGLYELNVTDGYVTTAAVAGAQLNTYASKVAVDDGFVVIDDAVVDLADDCAIYDANDPKAITEGTLNAKDIFSYTLNSDNEITSIYVGFTAPEDGVTFGTTKSVAAYEKYLDDVLLYETADAHYHAGLKDDGILIKYTVSDAAANKTGLKVVFTNEAEEKTTFSWTEVGNYDADSTHSVMFDLGHDWAAGQTITDGHGTGTFAIGTYEYEVTLDNVLVAYGSFDVE